MRLIPEGTPKDQAGPCPLSERVEEVAQYIGGTNRDPSPRRYQHYYYCPACGNGELPCHHWAEPRGFGTPHKPRVEQMRLRRKVKTHHNDRAFPL